MINMVNKHPLRDIYNLAVHLYYFLLSPAYVYTSTGVKAAFCPVSIPFIFIKPFIIIGIDYCVFALR